MRDTSLTRESVKLVSVEGERHREYTIYMRDVQLIVNDDTRNTLTEDLTLTLMRASQGVKGYYFIIEPLDYHLELDTILSNGGISAYRVYNAIKCRLIPRSKDHVAENKFFTNIKEIAQDINISASMVHRTFRYFRNVNVLKRQKKGHYLVNPRYVACFSLSRLKWARQHWDNDVVDISSEKQYSETVSDSTVKHRKGE